MHLDNFSRIQEEQISYLTFSSRTPRLSLQPFSENKNVKLHWIFRSNDHRTEAKFHCMQLYEVQIIIIKYNCLHPVLAVLTRDNNGELSILSNSMLIEPISLILLATAESTITRLRVRLYIQPNLCCLIYFLTLKSRPKL